MKRLKCPICQELTTKVYSSERSFIKRFYCKFCDRIYKEATIIEYNQVFSSWIKPKKEDLPKIGVES